MSRKRENGNPETLEGRQIQKSRCRQSYKKGKDDLVTEGGNKILTHCTTSDCCLILFIHSSFEQNTPKLNVRKGLLH